MNIKVTDPWIVIPTAAVYCGLGALISGAVFNKLSHLVEYTFNKKFGDYKNPKMTLDKRIIVSMPRYVDCYYLQNTVLAILIAAISAKAVQTLVSGNCPSIIAIPLLVGSVAAPILFGLSNMIARQSGGHHGRWVELSGDEINMYGINANTVEKITWSERVYCGFGRAPKYFPGESTGFI